MQTLEQLIDEELYWARVYELAREKMLQNTPESVAGQQYAAMVNVASKKISELRKAVRNHPTGL